MLRIAWDTFPPRRIMWEKLQMVEWDCEGAADPPTFFVVHSTHVSEEIAAKNRRWSSAAGFEDHVRKQLGQSSTAILYISGAEDPRQPHPGKYPRLDVPSDNPWTHVYVGSLLGRDLSFETRLQKLLTNWEQHEGALRPDWHMLEFDPVAEVQDFLTGLGLVLQDPQRRQAFVEAHSSTFEQAVTKLGLTQEERHVLDAAQGLRDNTKASLLQLDRAINLIQGFRPLVRRSER